MSCLCNHRWADPDCDAHGTPSLDKRIKKLFPVGMRDCKDLEIYLRCGFELQNTRPYHNYETWSHEWQALIDGRVVAKAEYLDELVKLLEERCAE
jgi:hypothetical protein